jgi:hypothetical protein
MKYLIVDKNGALRLTNDPVDDFEQGKITTSDTIYSLGPKQHIKIGLDTPKFTRSSGVL